MSGRQTGRLVLAAVRGALLSYPSSHGRSFPKIGRLQGREDELCDPGLTGEPWAGHVQNLDAIRPDKLGKFLPRRLDSGMQMQERLSVLAGKIGLLRSA